MRSQIISPCPRERRCRSATGSPTRFSSSTFDGRESGCTKRRAEHDATRVALTITPIDWDTSRTPREPGARVRHRLPRGSRRPGGPATPPGVPGRACRRPSPPRPRHHPQADVANQDPSRALKEGSTCAHSRHICLRVMARSRWAWTAASSARNSGGSGRPTGSSTAPWQPVAYSSTWLSTASGSCPGRSALWSVLLASRHAPPVASCSRFLGHRRCSKRSGWGSVWHFDNVALWDRGSSFVTS